MIRKGQLLSESVLNAAFMSKSEYNSILGDITTIGSMTAETIYVTGNNLEVGGKNDNATSLWLKRTASSHAWRVKNEDGILSFMGGNANASLERMRINSSGEVSIGTTTGGYKLYVNGSINSSSIYIGGAQKNLNWDAAFTHKSNNGSDHSYINQSVTTAASPSFTGLTVTNTISGKISGNAGTATKLATARTINGVDFDGSANITIVDSTKEPSFTKNTAFNKNFGTTSGTVTQGNDSRLSNARTPLAHTHTRANITDLGNIAGVNTNASTTQYLRGDGTWTTPPNTNTTYSAMSVAEGTAGTATSSRTVRADYLKQIINSYIPTSLPANGGNADTVGGFIVGVSVPANAKFTDTTYSEIPTAEIDAGTASTQRTITGRRIKYTLDKVQAWLDNKVDKVSGKGLSSNDYTSTEKNKLAGIATGATKNSTDATLLSRANHTGTQAPSTIAQDASNRFMTDTERTKLGGIATGANNYVHPAGTNPHGTTKSDVGLGSVDNVKQMPIAGGTFTGVAVSRVNTSYTTRQLRNVVMSTANPSGGSNGDIWIKYV